MPIPNPKAPFWPWARCTSRHPRRAIFAKVPITLARESTGAWIPPVGARVLLLESSRSHSECLHAQIRFLNAVGVPVHLWINADSPFRLPADEHVVDMQTISGTGLSDRLRTGLALRRYARQHRITTVLFNTAHGLFTRDVAYLLAGTGVRLAGLCHHAEKMGVGATQNLISRRVHRYFVLHPYMKRWAKPTPGVTIEPFYNIFFVDPTEQGSPVLPAPGEEIRVVLPGGFEPNRRDYPCLLHLARTGQIPPSMKIVLLGDCTANEHGLALRDTLRAEGLDHHFVLFEGYVSDEVFFEEMRRAAVVLPLLHPGLFYWHIFSQYSISGSYNLAFAFRKPILSVTQPFSSYEIFRDVGLFYQPEALGILLQRIAADPAGVLGPCIQAYRHLPELGFSYQARHYAEFLLG